MITLGGGEWGQGTEQELLSLITEKEMGFNEVT